MRGAWHVLAALAALPLLAGCTHWPPPGQGGLAELAAPPAETETAAPDTVQLRLSCAVDRLAQYRQAATQRGRLTGRLALVGLTAARAQREYYGGLKADAEHTLDELGSELAELRAILAAGAPPGPESSLPKECS